MPAKRSNLYWLLLQGLICNFQPLVAFLPHHAPYYQFSQIKIISNDFQVQNPSFSSPVCSHVFHLFNTPHLSLQIHCQCEKPTSSSIILITVSMQKLKGKQEWTQEQKTLLAELFPKYSSKKWKMISMELAQKGFKRTELECREKWINFLDPSLNNEEWSSTELQRLYNYHDKYGTRWCFMQKELNRTQNRIKNRFYGTIRNYIRLVLNTLCQRNTCFNTQINKISPSLLNDLYNSENIFDFLRGEIKKMIYRMKFKIDKKVLRNRIRDKESLYRELLGLIGSLFKGSFSLKFLEEIEKQDPNEDVDELQEAGSVKEIQKQDFRHESKTIKRQHIQNVGKGEEAREKKPPSFMEDNIAEQASQIQNTNLIPQQNNQNINSPQDLYAINDSGKNKAITPEQYNRNNQGEASIAQSESFYPFYNHNPDAIQHDLMINSLFRQQSQFETSYHFIIEKIRLQNIMMMQRQQQILIGQLINEFGMHGK